MATILTDPSDKVAIRGMLGVEESDLSDPVIDAFIEEAELDLSDLVDEMSVATSGAVPTVAQIMNNPPISPANSRDQLRLKLAARALVAAYFGPSATNAIDTSVTEKVGPVEVTKDRGGIGFQWREPMDIMDTKAGKHILKITNWPQPTQTLFSLSGPTSSGARANTSSGFWAI